MLASDIVADELYLFDLPFEGGSDDAVFSPIGQALGFLGDCVEH